MNINTQKAYHWTVNDEGVYTSVREMVTDEAMRILEQYDNVDDEGVKGKVLEELFHAVAEHIEWLEWGRLDYKLNGLPPMWREQLCLAMEDVVWYDIAQHYSDEIVAAINNAAELIKESEES